DSNSRFHGSLVHLDADSAVAPDAETATSDISRPSYKHLSACDIEISLPILSFCNRGYDCPRDPNVQGQVRGQSPFIVDVGSEQLPTPTSGGAEVGLIVEGAVNLTEKEIGRGVAGQWGAVIDEEPVLEGIGFHVHLIGAHLPADTDVVVPANHVERVRNREHVRSTLEGCEPTITKSPVVPH